MECSCVDAVGRLSALILNLGDRASSELCGQPGIDVGLAATSICLQLLQQSYLSVGGRTRIYSVVHGRVLVSKNVYLFHVYTAESVYTLESQFIQQSQHIS